MARIIRVSNCEECPYHEKLYTVEFHAEDVYICALADVKSVVLDKTVIPDFCPLEKQNKGDRWWMKDRKK